MEIELIIIIVKEPVESPYLIRTVVGTIPGTDTTIVSHMILSLAAVGGSSNRAYRFAGSMVTMLTHYRLESYLWIGGRHFHFFKTGLGFKGPGELVFLNVILLKSIFLKNSIYLFLANACLLKLLPLFCQLQEYCFLKYKLQHKRHNLYKHLNQ